ncbi:MAG: GNAT family N-acetyltransferase [Segatella copri]
MNEPRFIEIEDLKPDYLEAINRLIAQLSTCSHTFTEAELNSLIASPQSHLYALEYDEKIIGMVTLCIYQCPTGRKAWIEDVVVDQNHRGKGYGKLMVRKAMEECQNRGNVTLMLTSRPSRIVANQLYQSLGFEKRETNVYKMKF